MKTFKMLHVSIDFSTNLLIIPQPEHRTNAYFQNFLNLYLKFRENFN